MKYRLTRQSKNFPIPGAKVFWDGTSTLILVGDDENALSVDQSFNPKLAKHVDDLESAEDAARHFNANLGPGSPKWEVEEAA